jgi:DNA-binding response OmpR family regulator
MRIPVAEDDAALASFLKKGLESEHYAVDLSADGEQARAMAGELDFDLVVLDLICRDWTGWPCCDSCALGNPACPSWC